MFAYSLCSVQNTFSMQSMHFLGGFVSVPLKCCPPEIESGSTVLAAGALT